MRLLGIQYFRVGIITGEQGVPLYGCRGNVFPFVLAPVSFKLVGLLGGQMHHGPMLGSVEIRGFHHSFVETSQVFKCDEVRRFGKGEIVRRDTIYIVHQHPFVLSEAFPYRGSLARFRFKIVPTRIVFVVSADTVGNSLLDTRLSVVGHIEKMVLIPYFGDVAVDGRNRFVWVFVKQLGQALDTVEIIVHVHVIQFVAFVAEAHGVVNHQFAHPFVVGNFGCPCATYFTQSGCQLVETDVGAFPIYQVPRLHQHQSLIVSPTVHVTVALPLRFTVAVAAGKDMEVGHGQIECTVRSTVDIGVAYPSLVSNRIAGQDGFPVVQSRERVSVAAQCHVKAVRFVLVEHHQVGTQVFLLWHGVFITEPAESGFTFPNGNQPYT